MQASNSKCWPNARVAALTRAVADGAASCGCLCFCHASCLSYPSCLSWGKLGLGDPQIGGVPFRCPLKSLFWDLLGRLQALVSVFIRIRSFLGVSVFLAVWALQNLLFCGPHFLGSGSQNARLAQKKQSRQAQTHKNSRLSPKNKKQACGVFYLKFY